MGYVANEAALGHYYVTSFDFSMLFENNIFLILPSAVFIAAAPFHAVQHRRGPAIGVSNSMLWSKLMVVAALLMLEICMSIEWYANPDLFVNPTKTASSMPIIAACCIAYMVTMEHRCASQSSTAITVYLSLTLISDAIKTRSFFLRPGLEVAGTLSFAICIIKLLLLILLEMPKEFELEKKPPCRNGALLEKSKSIAESISGFCARTLLSWANCTLLLGFRTVQSASDLHKLGSDFEAHQLAKKFEPIWKDADKKSTSCLLESWLHTLKRAFLIPAVPRICQAIFSFSLPPLMKQILHFVGLNAGQQVQVLTSTKIGYILSFTLIYVGIGISKASHTHLMNRHATLLGSLLKGQIIKKNIRLKQSDADRSAAVTLMNTDVDAIIVSMEAFHSTWIAFPEFAFALYFLYTTIGLAFLLPIVPIAVSVVASNVLMEKMAPASAMWNEAIEERVSKTAKVLSQMKPIKVLGLESIVTGYLQGLHENELQQSLEARQVDIDRRSLFPLAYAFTPLVTITGAIFGTSLINGLDPVTVFVLMAYLYLIYEPLYSILNSWADVAAALGCFSRLQEFLLRSEHKDSRRIVEYTEPEAPTGRQALARATPTVRYRISTPQEYISFLATSVKSANSNDRIFRHLNISFSHSSLAMIIGPAGSGKSALLKTLLGEATIVGGALHVPPDKMAFCDHRPWLPNLSIRESVVGQTEFDTRWYSDVIEACCLDHDIQNLPEGDETKVGTNGRSLSSGQKQRVALARAVYSRSPILILDDVLSGLDAETSFNVFARLFATSGILREQKRTVILATSTFDYLAYADDIFVLDTYGDVVKRPLEALEHLIPPLNAPTDPDQNDTADGAARQAPLAEVAKMQRSLKEATPKAGDFTMYSLFLEPVSRCRLVTFVVLISLVGMLERMPEIFLRIWVGIAPSNRWLLLGLVGIAFGAVFVNYVTAQLYMVKIVPTIARKVHALFHGSLMAATLPFITSTGISSIVNRTSQDMTTISQALPMAFYRVVYSGASVLTDTGIIVAGVRYAGCMIPIIIASLFVVQLFYLRSCRQLRQIDLGARTQLLTKVTETAAGVEHIRGFGWEQKTLQESFRLLDESQRPFYYRLSVQRWLVLVLDLSIAVIGATLTMVAIIWPTTTNQSSLGLALVGTIGYSQGFTYLTNQWTALETSLGAISRLGTFINEAPAEKETPDAKARDDECIKLGEIDFKNLSAAHSLSGRVQNVLHDVSFTARPGDKVVLTGRTGSGKSSLLLCLLGFLDYAGTITIDGIDIASIPRQQLRKMITTIPQEVVDIPGSVYDNLVPLELTKSDGEAGSKEYAVNKALSRVGLLWHINDRGGIFASIEDMEFSADQRQLISLARAMLHHDEFETKIVLMDEATCNTNFETESIMQHVMEGAFRRCTRLIVANRPVSYSDCDYLVALNDGRVEYTVDMTKQRAKDEATRKQKRQAVESWMDGTSQELSGLGLPQSAPHCPAAISAQPDGDDDIADIADMVDDLDESN